MKTLLGFPVIPDSRIYTEEIKFSSLGVSMHQYEIRYFDGTTQTALSIKDCDDRIKKSFPDALYCIAGTVHTFPPELIPLGAHIMIWTHPPSNYDDNQKALGEIVLVPYF
jgi:hypothetical protein